MTAPAWRMLAAGLALLAVGLPVRAEDRATPAAAAVAEQCLRVESAFARNDTDALAALILTEPRWRTLRQFRLAAAYIPAEQHAAARKAVLGGLELANTALEQSPDDPEWLLLGAMLDGQMLLLRPLRFLHNGRRGLRRLRRAETLEPDNPRAALVRGTAEVILPKLLGGNPSRARERFQNALAAPAADGRPFAASTLCGNGEWAQVDLLNWLGRAHAKLKNPDASQAAYRRALARSPGNHWVRLAVAGQGYDWTDDPTR